jgi:hypothetical protein
LLKKLPAICLAASIGFASIILPPVAAMAQSSTLTPAQVAAEFEEKYPATAAARAHPVQCPIVGDVVVCPGPTSKGKPVAGTPKNTKPTVRAPAKQTEAQRRDAALQKGEAAEKKLSAAAYRAQFTVAKPSHEGVIKGDTVLVNGKPAN